MVLRNYLKWLFTVAAGECAGAPANLRPVKVTLG